jgi:hypothetical protein
MNSRTKKREIDQGLSRNDIEKYLSTSDHAIKNSIERKAHEHSMDQTALEGWSANPSLVGSLDALDKKFKPNAFQPILSMVVAGLIVLLMVVSFRYWGKSQDTRMKPPETEMAEDSIAVHQKVSVPKEIAQMEVLPTSKQILPSRLKEEFEQKLERGTGNFIYSVDFSDFQFPEDQQLEEIPLIKSQPILGKEVAYHGFKLLDYRAYRSKPVVKISVHVLTGTSADQEMGSMMNDEFSKPTREVPYIEYIEHTMWMFSKGQIKQTLTRLETVLTTYPDDLNANFYAGLCYYNLQQYGKAISCFNVCLENYFQNFDEETIWYMARSYYANGDKHIALDLFHKIKQAGGFYANQANAYLGG